MKQINWHWDLNIPTTRIKKILADENSPGFAGIAARLVTRVDDPNYVFEWISGLAFCKHFYAILNRIKTDRWEWSKEKEAFWKATYRRLLKQFKEEKQKIREKRPRKLDFFYNELVAQLKRCRVKAHMTQKELASQIGCNQKFISAVETGQAKISIDFLRKFSEATNSDLQIWLHPLGTGMEKEQSQQAMFKPSKEVELGLREWLEQERAKALEIAQENNLQKGLMQVIAYLPETTLNVSQDRLHEAMELTQIHIFGRPIGLVMTREDKAPKPFADGIRATILVDDKTHFDYWALRNDGVFYLLKTLFEDTRSKRQEGEIFIDTRVVRVTETLIRLSRLYKKLGVQGKEKIVVKIRHSGLRGRVLSVASPMRMPILHERPCLEEEIETVIEENVGDIESKIVELVYRIVSELAILFNFFKVSKEGFVAPVVENFKNGRII